MPLITNFFCTRPYRKKSQVKTAKVSVQAQTSKEHGMKTKITTVYNAARCSKKNRTVQVFKEGNLPEKG